MSFLKNVENHIKSMQGGAALLKSTEAIISNKDLNDREKAVVIIGALYDIEPPPGLRLVKSGRKKKTRATGKGA